MSPSLQFRTREVEDEHWWFAVRNELVLGWLAELLPGGCKVVDAGCGTGGLLSRLDRWQALGFDLDDVALGLCRQRGLHGVIKADIACIPLPTASVDAVLCLDVLYHQQARPEESLAEFWRILSPGGVLLLNLAAHRGLAGEHDRQVCGVRRHSMDMVRGQLARLNFDILRMHHWNVALTPLIWLWRRLAGQIRPGHTDLWMPPALLNRALRGMVSCECGMAEAVGCRLGSSLFVAAIKPHAEVADS